MPEGARFASALRSPIPSPSCRKTRLVLVPPPVLRTVRDARAARRRHAAATREAARPDAKADPPGPDATMRGAAAPCRPSADGERKPYQRRDGEKPPYQRRDDRPRGVGAPPRARRDAPAAAPPARREPKSWGGVTRRGARQVTNPTPASEESRGTSGAAGIARLAPRSTGGNEPKRRGRPLRRLRQRGRPARAKALPADVVEEVASAATSARRAPLLQKRLGDAVRHMERGRGKEAAAVLRQLAQEVPEAASVRELYGHALYQLGRYRQAATELEAFVSLTASTEQHPMLADCYRDARALQEGGRVVGRGTNRVAVARRCGRRPDRGRGGARGPRQARRGHQLA